MIMVFYLFYFIILSYVGLFFLQLVLSLLFDLVPRMFRELWSTGSFSLYVYTY